MFRLFGKKKDPSSLQDVISDTQSALEKRLELLETRRNGEIEKAKTAAPKNKRG